MLDKVKEKIEKLLRLSLSSNPNEAKLATQKAVELMQRYAIDHTDFSKMRSITKRIEINYARIPVWLRELYNGLSYVNGCYMVWSNGRRDKISGKISEKAEIFLTGRECDVLNTEYLLHIFIREIDRMGEEYKLNLPKGVNKRERLKSYKLGLGQGLCNRLLEANDVLANSEIGKELIPMGDYHERFMNSMEKFLNDNKVSYIINEIDENDAFKRGVKDAKDVDIHKPLDGHNEILLPLIK
jgi:hypothetical protein